jgi:hypothetical protein
VDVRPPRQATEAATDARKWLSRGFGAYRLTDPAIPSEGPASGSPEVSDANVTPIAPPPTVPRPPEPSRAAKRKISAAEQQNRDIRKSAVWRDHAAGRIDDGEAQRRIDEIDAAPPEACGAA